jgi:preprotein translocase subunit SecG
VQTILVILHVLFALSIVGLVLLQRSEGGGLGMGGGGGGGGAGGMSGLMSARGTANLLTRATAIAAALFFTSSLVLSMLVANSNDSRSIVEGMEIPSAVETTAEPTEPSVPVAE